MELQTVFIGSVWTREYSKQRTTPSIPDVRRHIDQTLRTRSFRAMNETVERGAVTKNQNGRKTQRGKGGGRMLSVESNRTMFERRPM